MTRVICREREKMEQNSYLYVLILKYYNMCYCNLIRNKFLKITKT